MEMEVKFEVPDEIAAELGLSGETLSREALEAFAADGYRLGKLSESEVRRLLGFDIRFQVHGFLKDRKVYLNYDMEDLEADLRAFDKVRSLAR